MAEKRLAERAHGDVTEFRNVNAANVHGDVSQRDAGASTSRCRQSKVPLCLHLRCDSPQAEVPALSPRSVQDETTPGEARWALARSTEGAKLIWAPAISPAPLTAGYLPGSRD